MPRIVAGIAGGRRLRVPPEGTRPTSDRVREAVFNAVISRIDLDGARVLELYAGSGALGLEALSRGAAHVLLVESDARAAATVKANAAVVDLPGAEVRTASVASVLAGRPDTPYDLVFADPPYAVSDEAVRADLTALVANDWVEPGSVVALERSSRSPDTDWPDGYEVLRVRKYGEAKIELTRVADPDSV